MSVATNADLIGHRSELLAKVVLTRRLNVDVHPFDAKGDSGLDLICTIRDEKNRGFLPFAVIVWGTAEELDDEMRATAYARHHKKKLKQKIFLMPAIVLLFSMQHDEAYFAWLVEPSDEDAKLIQIENLAFAQFTPKQLDRMLTRIKKWYQRTSAALVTSSSNGEPHSASAR